MIVFTDTSGTMADTAPLIGDMLLQMRPLPETDLVALFRFISGGAHCDLGRTGATS